MTTDWLPSVECADLLGVTDRRIRQLVQEGKVVARRGQVGANSGGLLILADSLPQAAREKLSDRLVEINSEAPSDSRHPQFDASSPRIRSRAMRRLETVRSYRATLRRRLADGMRMGEAEADWLADYQHRAHFNGSLKSVRRWSAAYRTRGLDGLLDHNDGSARRGKFAVPPEALAFFFESYLDKKRPGMTIAAAIRETRYHAQETGWSLPKRDDSFYRFAKQIPKLVLKARKTAIDERCTIEAFVQREMDVPYRTLQSDHHLCDVFVNCEGQVCGDDGCRGGHRPWLTMMFDVGSRKVISHQISLDIPNYLRILNAFYLAVVAEGIPQRFYVDNGKDFTKATGSSDDASYLESRFRVLGIEVVKARPYNAQAKSIERMHGTLVTRVWRTYESWTGYLGKRSEHANYLCKNPEKLPTFTAFCDRLDSEIEIYNHTAHRGFGMKGRTPAQVFAKERIARRDPDAFALALVFYRCETRTLDRNGVRIDNLTYRLNDAAVQKNHQGERVKVLIDPKDISRAIICSIDEKFLCEAREIQLATNDTRDAITQEVLETVAKSKKATRAAANAGDIRARFAVTRLRATLPGMLRREAARRRQDEEQLVAAVGAETAVSVVLPRFSKIARDVVAHRDDAAHRVPPALSAADQVLAATVAPLTDERLDQLLAENGRGFTPAPGLRLAGSSDEDDQANEIEREWERSRIRRARKLDCGECLTDDCERRATEADVDGDDNELVLCRWCWFEKFGAAIDDPAVRESFRRSLEEQ